MTWYADLGPIDAGPFGTAPSLRAVGWLDEEHSFETGAVSAEDFETLCRLLVDPWQPFATAGRHRCELCSHTGGPASLSYRDHEIRLGAAKLFVPDGEELLVAPSLIVHYIDAHRYRPPQRFLSAVRACPPMKSAAYKAALLAAGGGALLRSTSPH